MKQVTIGLLAHVDAGKTTLSESLLYQTGQLRNLGRVDHQNSFLDYNALERKKGITIFSKQANFEWNQVQFHLLDTPGHVDFSAEMERVLRVLDMAILVINGSEGVQAHTFTIWKLLALYHVPTLIFVNKMDIAHLSREEILTQLQCKIHANCLDFSIDDEALQEQMALCHDSLLEKYTQEKLTFYDIQKAFYNRYFFPCYFGSALKQTSLVDLLDELSLLAKDLDKNPEFGAKVFKISYVEGIRLTHVKITSGELKVKSWLRDEKVDEIRYYSGTKYQLLDKAQVGDVVALKGLKHILAGEGLGIEENGMTQILQPYMNYCLILPKDCDFSQIHTYLKQLEEEEPLYHFSYSSNIKEIELQLMGEIQIEVLKNLIEDRFHVPVEFDHGRIHYKETIAQPVEGVGHFEPLRHYAEVHLKMEPLPLGSGLVFASEVSEDELARNWQRLVLTHLHEKEHKGVLTGSPITDMKITLIAGKAHLKHTEGGDFREATYRAIRQGLKQAQSILLEPIFDYRMEIPTSYLSKAIYDIEQMQGTFEEPLIQDDRCVLVGLAPVSQMRDYPQKLIHETKGQGKLVCVFKQYAPVQNPESIIESFHYESEMDLDNPTGSIFCQQGAGFYVPWYEVAQYMHIKKQIKPIVSEMPATKQKRYEIDEQELQRIFERSMPAKKRVQSRKKELDVAKVEIKKTIQPMCMLVDGYNMIYSWEELAHLAKSDLNAARDKLIDWLCDYQGYKNMTLILVFDAYKVKDNAGKVNFNGAIHIVYTKTAQTADAYIEKATHELASHFQIVVATSDSLEQLIVIGQGARRMSARELFLDMEYTKKENRCEMERKQSKVNAQVLADLRNIELDEKNENFD